MRPPATRISRSLGMIAALSFVLGAFLGAPAPQAIATQATAVQTTDATLTVKPASIGAQETTTISFDVGVTSTGKNWIGIYKKGDKPGDSASLDWRYVNAQNGELNWGPSARESWERNGTVGITAGNYDIYLLKGTGYEVLAGPIDLAVTESATPQPVQPAEPKPKVNGASELNVLTLNAWLGGSQITDGAKAIADIISEYDVDVAFLPERGTVPKELAKILGYQELTATNTGIVSRYPIKSTGTVGKWWSKAVLDVNGTDVVVYGGHLEYRWYTTYLPRGYGGEVIGAEWPAGWGGWAQLSAPVTDVGMILKANEQSGRPAAAAELTKDIGIERKAGRVVVVGGDFNEPSAQDWTEATANVQDHQGVVIPWQTTQTLLDSGLVDTFREVYPDPLANPGVTWPSDNPAFPVSKLTWAPKADERDRIDYIFVSPDSRLKINGSNVVGPQSSIVRSERVEDESSDQILTPKAPWPTDHKAVLTKFSVYEKGCGATTPPLKAP